MGFLRRVKEKLSTHGQFKEVSDDADVAVDVDKRKDNDKEFFKKKNEGPSRIEQLRINNRARSLQKYKAVEDRKVAAEQKVYGRELTEKERGQYKKYLADKQKGKGSAWDRASRIMVGPKPVNQRRGRRRGRSRSQVPRYVERKEIDLTAGGLLGNAGSKSGQKDYTLNGLLGGSGYRQGQQKKKKVDYTLGGLL